MIPPEIIDRLKREGRKIGNAPLRRFPFIYRLDIYSGRIIEDEEPTESLRVIVID